MRIVPDSLAGRTSTLLIGGLLVTAALSFFASHWGDTSNELHRIAAVVSVANRLPAESRSVMLARFSEAGLEYSWSATAEDSGLEHDFLSHHFARDLRVALSDPSLSVADAGYAQRAAAPAGQPKGRSVLEALFQLADQSHVTVRIDPERVAALGLGRISITLLVLVGGIAALGIWASHRLTDSLSRFAGAAHRLGTDVSAPSIEERGPREVREAASAFNQMQARIRRFVEDRTLMLAAISHDLRTGLTRLRLRAEYIGDESQRAKALADLDEMQAMLSATLAFGRDDAAQDESSHVDLAVLLQSLTDDATDGGHPASFDGPAHWVFTGRPIALKRLFSNLIDNAIKYGRTAEVGLVASEQTVQITVGDRGPGIPLEQRERVFAPFFRLESSRNRETGGAGLGLTVARSLARHHGGDITLEDREGGGLLARVVLPVGAGRDHSHSGRIAMTT